MATPAQKKAKDQKWANKSWKPYLWMATIGTILVIIAIACFIIFGIIVSKGPEGAIAPAGAIAAMVLGAFLLFGGIPLTGAGIALIVVTCIKRNKARERLGLPKE